MLITYYKIFSTEIGYRQIQMKLDGSINKSEWTKIRVYSLQVEKQWFGSKLWPYKRQYNFYGGLALQKPHPTRRRRPFIHPSFASSIKPSKQRFFDHATMNRYNSIHNVTSRMTFTVKGSENERETNRSFDHWKSVRFVDATWPSPKCLIETVRRKHHCSARVHSVHFHDHCDGMIGSLARPPWSSFTTDDHHFVLAEDSPDDDVIFMFASQATDSCRSRSEERPVDVQQEKKC